MRGIACGDCVVGALIALPDPARPAPAAPGGAPFPGRRAGAAGTGTPGSRPRPPSAGAGAQDRTGPGPGGRDGRPGDRDGGRGSGDSLPGAARRGPGTAGEAERAGRPGPEIGEPERRALRALAAAGLVPPLRLVLPGAEAGAGVPAGPEPAGEFPETAGPADAAFPVGGEFPDAEAS